MRVCRVLILSTFPLLMLARVNGQQGASLSPLVLKYVRVNAPRVVLEHVRVIDGTGQPAVEDRNVVIERGLITAVDAGSDTPTPDGTTVLDLRGHTVIPGIIGMHDHLFYVGEPGNDSQWNSEPPELLPQMTFSAPRLYLAGGVTTIRTTGSVEPYTDLNLRHAIEQGKLPGPHIDVTGPYLDGPNKFFIQFLHSI